MELIVFGSKILNMFQGFVNKMTVIMKFSAMGPIDIPPWCNIYEGLRRRYPASRKPRAPMFQGSPYPAPGLGNHHRGRPKVVCQQAVRLKLLTCMMAATAQRDLLR
jgi:hypothetical protein